MKVKIHIVCSILLGFSFMLNGCNNTTTAYPSSFYRIDRNELDALIEKAGIEDFSVWHQSVERNSSGTTLRLHDLWNKPIVVMSCDGSIATIDIKSHTSWLNDSNEVIVWRDSGVVHYNNGYSETSHIVAYGGTDPSGQYFYKNYGNKRAGVYSINDPKNPLVVLDAFRLKLFAKNNEIHIFGQKSGYFIDAYICKIEEGKLKIIDEYKIEKQGQPYPSLSITDYNMNTGDLVIRDGRDWPSKSRWYLYNNNAKILKPMGKVENHEHGLFMDCDIVEAVSSRLAM